MVWNYDLETTFSNGMLILSEGKMYCAEGAFYVQPNMRTAVWTAEFPEEVLSVFNTGIMHIVEENKDGSVLEICISLWTFSDYLRSYKTSKPCKFVLSW